MKASIGIEPMHSGFADQSLTTWVRRHKLSVRSLTKTEKLVNNFLQIDS